MDTIVNIIPVRSPEDLAGEGMWWIAVGNRCPECWEELPEDQKEWWRRCAMHAIREWFAEQGQPM